jgi:DNA-binding GntR family transcriptional regulator
MDKVYRKGARAKVNEELKQSIIEGKLRPGARLLEGELAEKMGVSRTPVREALAQLEKEQIIKRLHPRGYKVSELNHQHIDDIFGLREVLESYAGVLAIERITKEDIKKLESIISRSEQQFEKESMSDILELNATFHRTISEASGNNMLTQFLDQIGNHVLRYRALLIQQRSLYPQVISDHRRIVEVLKKKDPEALREAIVQHVRQTKRNLLSVTSAILE